MRLYYKLLFVLLLCSVIHNTVNADTLTIRQTFNLQVGDSLRYRNYEPYVLCYDMRKIYRFTGYQSFKIISKQNSGDTLQYIMQATDNDIYHSTDTVMINNLDSPITSYTGILNPHYSQRMFFDAHIIDSNAYLYTMYDGREADNLISNRCEASFFESNHRVNYITGIGVFNNEYFGWADGPGVNPEFCAGGIGTQLIYYQSDSTTWMDTTSIYYLNITDAQKNAPSFTLFPSPANNEITITGWPVATKIQSIAIYNVTGQCLLTINNSETTTNTISVAGLPNGFYWLKVSDGVNAATRSFIVSR